MAESSALPGVAATDGEALRRAHVADRLHFAAMRLVRLARGEDRDLGPSAAQLSIVSRLVQRGATALGELADLEGVRPPTLTRAVQALERDGYVVRRTSREDARVSVVSATATGWRLLEEARLRRAEALRLRLDALEPDELRALEEAVALIDRIVDSG